MSTVCPPTRTRHAARLRSLVLLPCVVAVLSACQSATVSPTAAPVLPTAAPTVARVERQPIPNGPTLLREHIELRKVADVLGGSIKLVASPSGDALLYLSASGGVFRVPLQGTATPTQVAKPDDIAPNGGTASGLAISADGTLFVVSNQQVEDKKNQATIRRGTPAGTSYTWSTLATTEPYPLSSTPFDHMFNGALVSADSKTLYVNSGSRTDHGEVEDNDGAFPDTREVGLTAKIFKLPTDATDLILPNDEAALQEQGLIVARGTRNAYDMALAPNGDLFATDNGPDADYPEELNWIREGQHYGFPWRFGSQDNPQQLPDYDPAKDKRLSEDFTAVKTNKYHNDPSFPKPPGAFTAPIANSGPDAVQNRTDDGSAYDSAKQGTPLTSFTPHRSPLGLVFAASDTLPETFRSNGDSLGAFVLSWGAAGGDLTDAGQDLLFLRLAKQAENYTMTSDQIATGFSRPIDAVLLGNKLYVLENGEGSKLWELTFS